MNEVDRAFYEWFHTQKKSGVLIEHYQEAFLAGWAASIESLGRAADLLEGLGRAADDV